MNGAARLTERIGGPVGAHARPWGLWFNPLPWSILVAGLSWVVLMLRQVPCQQHVYGTTVNTYARLCYSDIPLLYQGNGVATGAGLYSEAGLTHPPLVGALVAVCRWLTGLFGADVGASATGQEQLDASYLFFVLTAVVLFVSFLAVVVVQAELGAGSASWATQGVATRSFDALLVAAAPVVMASGLINWDMLAVALVGLGVLAWARCRPLVAGVALGAAFSTKFFPVLVLVALALVCRRGARMGAWRACLGGFAAAWALINAPLLLTDPHGWSLYWSSSIGRGADLGSLWYVFELMGLRVPGVNAVCLLLMAAALCAIALLVRRAPRRPRTAQVILLVLIAFAVCTKAYAPQCALWLLPFVVMARPRVFDWAVWNIAELVYFFAVWGFLDGVLGPGTGADALYWGATLLRIGVQLWLAAQVCHDVLNPWDDPVRVGHVDDLTGGVLDHAVDAVPPPVPQAPPVPPTPLPAAGHDGCPR
ncbi:PF09594 family protein [Propionibacterium acidifaciens F0233]|uniref:PF09594 family protein n=1 Tax=Propionibacterium acidifaciens F0233 TaxID=553198 RepID=U2QH65_9ACTN|nr:glycosyltransferase 87 family protein [Propionibacterium acidifaciens]ERK62240.1 PF09594 family protein [Propionibacterium acidifaciens F0233]